MTLDSAIKWATENWALLAALGGGGAVGLLAAVAKAAHVGIKWYRAAKDRSVIAAVAVAALTGIDALPDNDQTKALKENVKALATDLGVEEHLSCVTNNIAEVKLAASVSNSPEVGFQISPNLKAADVHPVANQLVQSVAAAPKKP